MYKKIIVDTRIELSIEIIIRKEILKTDESKSIEVYKAYVYVLGREIDFGDALYMTEKGAKSDIVMRIRELVEFETKKESYPYAETITI